MISVHCDACHKEYPLDPRDAERVKPQTPPGWFHAVISRMRDDDAHFEPPHRGVFCSSVCMQLWARNTID